MPDLHPLLLLTVVMLLWLGLCVCCAVHCAVPDLHPHTSEHRLVHSLALLHKHALLRPTKASSPVSEYHVFESEPLVAIFTHTINRLEFQ